MTVPSGPIVIADGSVSEPFRTWGNALERRVDRLTPIVGSGSPEGVVDAPQHSEYINSSGTAGNIKWIKLQSDIGGDPKKGWVQL